MRLLILIILSIFILDEVTAIRKEVAPNSTTWLERQLKVEE